MKRKKDRKVKNINALLIAVVVVICIGVAAFAGVTIMNTDNLAVYTDEIYKRPFSVNNAAWKLRTQILFARSTMLNLLSGDDYPESQTAELNVMYAMRDNIAVLEETLESQYEGNPETVDQLVSDVNELLSIHDRCIQLIRDGKQEEAKTLLYEDAYPLYLRADDTVREITNNSSTAIDRYVKQAHELNEKANMMAIVWGSALLALAVLASTVSVHAITKRNEDIFHNNALFHIISENVDDVFMIYDLLENRVEYISDNVERILGISAESLKNNLWIARAYLDDETFQRLSKGFMEPNIGEIEQYEFIMTDPKTGHEKELCSRRYPITENGRVTKFVFVTSDLTDVNRAQSMLRSALERAENANTAKREFLSRMSHEIRTPMNAMTGMIRNMGYDITEPEKMKEHLRKLNMSTMHLLDLINDILDMSKIESGKMKIEVREFSLNAMLSEITDIMQPKAEESKQAFDVLLKNATCDMVKGDDMRIKQVLLNFLSNAIKFTPEHGKIRMSVEEMDRRGNQACLKFEVRDTGIGMHEEFLEHLFEPFEQEQGSTYRKYGGTGLGMALSKTLVESMGGEIEVESVPDMGSVFSFSLWLEIADAEGISIKISDEVKSLYVLIVEDDEEMREHLKLQCSQLGVEAVAVSSGIEAVKYMKESGERFDLCLLDLYMPDVDGIHTAEWIRSEAGKDVYIVLMSAYDHKNVEQEALAAGVDDFLTKPVMRADIYRILQRLSGELSPAANGEEKAKSYDFTGKRVLIAEDNEINMEVAQGLCEHVGFKVENAYNGKEAVEMFRKSPEGYYDAILMDVHMPIMNGNQAARTIRGLKRKDAHTVAIIAMTANAFYEDAAEAIKSGMNEHLAKPIEPEAIFAALYKFLYDKKDKS